MRARHIFALFGVLLILLGCTDDAPRFDFDHDGWEDAVDCVPDDPTVHPDADEVCDGKDNDCDGDVDEGFADNDTDGVATCAGDCNDNNSVSFPGAEELCDGEDNDCDGQLPGEEADVDGDGWMECEGDCNDNNEALNLDDADGDGWSTCAMDCDDADAELNLDDADGDGVDTCGPDGIPGTGDEDCDDDDASTYTGAAELCDGMDNDCDSVVPDSEMDTDGDGFMVCENDCDDASSAVNPGATELCDGLDTDCDSTIPSDEADDDGDGYMVCENDCDDAEPGANPGEFEVCGDGIDNDCDGTGNDCLLEGEIDLGAADATLVGEAELYWSGQVGPSGDVDGDGFNDIVVGASGEWGGVSPGAGYLTYGPVYGSLDLALADATFLGEEPGDEAGIGISASGDSNADGYDDVLLGAYRNDAGGSNAGAGYLLLGPLSGAIDLSVADAKLIGEDEGDFAGASVDWAGDLDGDGRSDVIIGAYKQSAGGIHAGAAYVFYSPVTGNVGLENADAKLVGETDGDQAGINVASAGDVDGDGYDDVLVGAWGDDSGGENAGAVYLQYGPFYGTIDLSTVDAKFVGEAAGDFVGYNTGCAGDVDGDGFDDILIGAFQESGGGVSAGAAYLVYGPAYGNIDLSLADAKFMGDAEGDEAGAAVSTAGDVDGDGFDDILIGARNADTGGVDAGTAYLFYGIPSGTAFLSTADAVIVGEAAGDAAAYEVATAGDVDGDGYDDILVGSLGNDVGGADAGAAYLIYGSGR
jgi:hypothetical protein